MKKVLDTQEGQGMQVISPSFIVSFPSCSKQFCKTCILLHFCSLPNPYILPLHLYFKSEILLILHMQKIKKTTEINNLSVSTQLNILLGKRVTDEICFMFITCPNIAINILKILNEKRIRIIL